MHSESNIHYAARASAKPVSLQPLAEEIYI